LVIAFNLPFSGVARGREEHAPWGAGLRGASTHFIQPFKNAVLSRNLDCNMCKNAYFF